MYIWIWETPGGRDFGQREHMGYWGNKGVSLRATGSRGGRIPSQQGGFQVSEQGEQGEQGERGNKRNMGNKGNKGNKGLIVYI
jgi:hypothetical protein